MEGAEGKAGHFEFIQASGKAHGLGEDLPYNNPTPKLSEHPATSTEFTEQELDEWGGGQPHEEAVAPELSTEPEQATSDSIQHETLTKEIESLPKDLLENYQKSFNREMLKEFGFNAKTWGKGSSVTVGDLLKKIPVVRGEALKALEDGNISLPKVGLLTTTREFSPYQQLANFIRMWEPKAGKDLPKAILKMSLKNWLNKAAAEDMLDNFAKRTAGNKF